MSVFHHARLGGMTAALVVAAAFPAAAAPPGNLSDLRYQDAGWSAGQLQSRGYVRTQGHIARGNGYEYWWHNADRQCIYLSASNGKVASVDTTARSDCGQPDSSSGKDKNDAAAVAIGAAAILGIAALAHNSHHHKNNQHAADSDSDADFERGYRDGLYHAQYDVKHGNNQYSDGYAAGVDDRESRTSYRSYHASYSSSSAPRRVTCESEGGRRQECEMDTAGDVRLVERLSKHPCNAATDWGISRHAVWVANGCRAVFEKR